MQKTIDFNYESGPEMTEVVQGKTIQRVEIQDEGMDDWLIFHFTDGTSLHIRYDWIYSFYLAFEGGNLKSA